MQFLKHLRSHSKTSTFSWMYKQYTFSDPPPPSPSIQTNILGFQKNGLMQHNIYCATKKLTRLRSLLSDKWYHWLCSMIYRLQLILYTSKFNLKIYFLYIQIKYVQFHKIKFKMPKSQLLIGLENSFKNWQKAQNVNIYFSSKAYVWFYPFPCTWWGYQMTKTVQNGGPQAISQIFHIEYWIVCYIETYLVHIYHMSNYSKCNWNRYIEGFCMWNVHFQINGFSPNIAYVILMSWPCWPLMAIYFLLLNYWLFSVQFSYHI